jgi:hypothetical protein
VSHASYDPLFIDLGLLKEEVEKILESNYGMKLEHIIKTNPKNKKDYKPLEDFSSSGRRPWRENTLPFGRLWARVYP